MQNRKSPENRKKTENRKCWVKTEKNQKSENRLINVALFCKTEKRREYTKKSLKQFWKTENVGKSRVVKTGRMRWRFSKTKIENCKTHDSELHS